MQTFPNSLNVSFATSSHAAIMESVYVQAGKQNASQCIISTKKKNLCLTLYFVKIHRDKRNLSFYLFQNSM